MRLVIARCQVDYAGRLTAHLPMATRLILLKADGSVSIHADDRAYKPLNWMSPPCSVAELPPPPEPGIGAEPLTALWEVRGRDGDTLQISIGEVFHDSSHELGRDPGLVKDGVEAHLQALLAEHPEALGAGWSLVRREHPTPIGPVDLLCRDGRRQLRRRGDQTARRDRRRRAAQPLPGPAPPRPAARCGDRASSLPSRSSRRPGCSRRDRGIACVLVDYDLLRGLDNVDDRLF